MKLARGSDLHFADNVAISALHVVCVPAIIVKSEKKITGQFRMSLNYEAINRRIFGKVNCILPMERHGFTGSRRTGGKMVRFATRPRDVKKYCN